MMTDFGENEENENLFSCVCIFMESDKDIMKVKVVLAISVCIMLNGMDFRII